MNSKKRFLAHIPNKTKIDLFFIFECVKALKEFEGDHGRLDAEVLRIWQTDGDILPNFV